MVKALFLDGLGWTWIAQSTDDLLLGVEFGWIWNGTSMDYGPVIGWMFGWAWERRIDGIRTCSGLEIGWI